MRRKKITIAIIIAVLAVAAVFSYSYYKKVFAPNISVEGSETFIYIPTRSDVASIATMLKTEGIADNINSFLWVAGKKNYAKNIIPGKYLVKDGMSNNDLINLLRSGKQTPVNVTFNNVRTINDLAGKISKYIETDSLQFIKYFDTTTYFTKAGLKKEQVMTLFLPDTYEFKWNTSATQFLQRMQKEHDKFWNDDRKKKLNAIQMSEQEVYTLASVVYSETKMSDEASRVAGVYMNRLTQNIPLQADPTIIFAIGDFSKTRVLFSDLQIQSPYNTYKYTGLPPGPICMPPKKYIDAVLNYEKHAYIYFCAKEDFSGYSNFAKTLEEHNRNAKKYQQALNEWEKKNKK
ncbi:MAG: endolytic transglycosylase MltG [Fimbriimonadaceae bacterium]|nr:endolytic transglycosylase MltG [Chitinophagales bacterium]